MLSLLHTLPYLNHRKKALDECWYCCYPYSKGEEIKWGTEQRWRLSNLNKISSQNSNVDILTLEPEWFYPSHKHLHQGNRKQLVSYVTSSTRRQRATSTCIVVLRMVSPLLHSQDALPGECCLPQWVDLSTSFNIPHKHDFVPSLADPR